MKQESPLGRTTPVPDEYSPDLLFAIPRIESRARIGLKAPLPFDGVDVWTAWELGWLGPAGQPRAGIAEIRVPAESPNIVESKSLKLYLGAFAMSRFDTADAVAEVIARDLSATVGSAVELALAEAGSRDGARTSRLPGRSLDALAVPCDAWQPDAGLLQTIGGPAADEEWHTDALRSLCPVTGQPDCGSISIRYAGPRIEPESLLRYLASYRRHQDFHESCAERIFVDILERCRPGRLTVHARYLRRGGIDINPFRSNFEEAPRSLRLWRQ